MIDMNQMWDTNNREREKKNFFILLCKVSFILSQYLYQQCKQKEVT